MTRSSWLESTEGTEFLRKRLDGAVQAFLEDDLGGRLAEELEALLLPDSSDFRFGQSLRRLSEELSILCLAEKGGLTAPNLAWESARLFLRLVSSIDEINFQGRTNRPKWNSDLTTAEVGVSLAMALHLDGGKRLDLASTELIVRRKCLEPVLADWLNHETRLHALDTMGHNWWSVIVGGAGIMAVVLGERELADRVSTELLQWFHYSGNDLGRKRRNFGEDGDFVESFHYADYGLYYPIAFSELHPAFRLVPDAMNERQVRGLASWMKQSILPVEAGYPQQRFGDVQFYDGFMGIVWQTVAELSGDDELREVAYRLRPEPRHLLEMLFWKARPPSLESVSPGSSLEVYANSGVAFIRGGDLRLTTRAGEFWGHNHLDAGSFVFCQDGVLWIDDSGACDYSRPEYPDYYVSAAAHNVAYSPALSPPSRRAHYAGLPDPARYLLAAKDGPVKILCSDTGILSGGALARSHRWFLTLGDEAVVIWDDLAAYCEQCFSFLLHSTTEVSDAEQPILKQGAKRCPLFFYSSVETQRGVKTVPMGQLSERGERPVQDLEGSVLMWESIPTERVKFGLVLGTAVRSAIWRKLEVDGAECIVQTERNRWRIWFNPQADGKVMHANRTASWSSYETDAHALVLQEAATGMRTHAVEASFVRFQGKVLAGSLDRRPLQSVGITKPAE